MKAGGLLGNLLKTSRPLGDSPAAKPQVKRKAADRKRDARTLAASAELAKVLR